MKDLIDRQSALSVCKEYAWIDDEDFIEGYNTAIKDISEAIKELPTFEAEPVRHGRWKGWTTSKFTGKYIDVDEPEFKDYKYYTCSECYRKSAIRELYCPSCGVRMEVNEDAGTD